MGADNLCHQVIFVQDATSAVTSLDPEMIQVSNAVGQRAERRGLVQGAVRPVGVRGLLHQIRVRSGSSRRQLPFHRSMTELSSVPAPPGG